MKRILSVPALLLLLAVSFSLFTRGRPTAANGTVTRWVGDGTASCCRSVSGGPPNTTVFYNFVQSSPGLVVYSLDQFGPYSDSLTLPISLNSSGNGTSATVYTKALQAGQTTETICSPQLGCASDSPTDYTVLTPASGVVKIQYLKDGSYVDVPDPLTVLKGDTVTFKALPSPANSVFFYTPSGPIDPSWSGTSGAMGVGDTTTPITFDTASSNNHDYKTVIATVQNGGSYTANVFVSNGVQSVTIDKIDAATIFDDNPNTGGGRRVFPDKNNPTDTVERKRVRVNAVTSLSSNKTVYFKSFDLDDPSANVAPIDPNSSAGNDNRGGQGTAAQFGLLSAVGGNGTTNSASAKTNSNGVASVDLKVTMQPGDNFMVAASDDLTYLNGLTVNQILLQDSSGTIVGSGTPKAKASPMLTVWRRLHVEVDSMGNVSGNNTAGIVQNVVTNPTTNTSDLTVNQSLEVNRFESGIITVAGVGYGVVSNTANVVTISGTNTPPVGSAFTLVDDDDFNSDDGLTLDGDNGENVVKLTQTFSRMQDSDNATSNVFAPAYIRPVYDGGGSATNDTGNVSFVLNIANNPTVILNQINLGINSGGNESDTFWVVYIQVDYQPDAGHDFDPNTETSVGGYTSAFALTDDVTNSAGVPRGGDGSLIFVETMRDRVRFPGSIIDTISAPHEVGHQFGLQGDVAGFGIMFNSSESPVFVDRHINVLRWRIKSPGQP